MRGVRVGAGVGLREGCCCCVEGRLWMMWALVVGGADIWTGVKAVEPTRLINFVVLFGQKGRCLDDVWPHLATAT